MRNPAPHSAEMAVTDLPPRDGEGWELRRPMAGAQPETIARSFYRLGWLGVVIQALLALNAITVFSWASFGTALGSRQTLTRTDLMVVVGLAILTFTTFWSYRYTRLAERIADPARRAPRSSTPCGWVCSPAGWASRSRCSC